MHQSDGRASLIRPLRWAADHGPIRIIPRDEACKQGRSSARELTPVLIGEALPRWSITLRNNRRIGPPTACVSRRISSSGRSYTLAWRPAFSLLPPIALVWNPELSLAAGVESRMPRTRLARGDVSRECG